MEHPNTATTTDHQSSVLVECGLDNVNCDKCNNSGQIVWVDSDHITHARECSCMKRRRAIRRLRDSGLRDLVQRYSFQNYETPTAEHLKVKKKAQEFACGSAEWFFICGRPGTGKTHVCTAICNYLLDRDYDIRYMVWRTEAADLKAMVNDREEYSKRMNQLRNAPVLYVDDLFKGSITAGDVNLAFTILNDRYNGAGKRTIISTELPLNEISKIDDAVAGRIAERARGFVLTAPSLNWRAKGG